MDMDRAEGMDKIMLKTGRWVVILVVGLIILGWLLNTPPGLLGKADAIGYSVCHRIDGRSFHLGDRQLPLCVRCSGMFLGAVIGLLYQFVRGSRRGGTPPMRVFFAMGVLVLTFAVDGLNSYLSLPFFSEIPTLYQPGSLIRLLTGSGMGLVIAVILFPAFNQTIWRNWDSKPAITGLRSFLVLCTIALLLDIAVLTEDPAVLYPLAIISAGGVLVLLSMVYAMLLVIVFRKENSYQRPAELWLPLLAGFGVGMVQVIVISLIRYAVTGTWEGFSFG
jgi:uncharacterized membrane protein